MSHRLRDWWTVRGYRVCIRTAVVVLCATSAAALTHTVIADIWEWVGQSPRNHIPWIVGATTAVAVLVYFQRRWPLRSTRHSGATGSECFSAEPGPAVSGTAVLAARTRRPIPAVDRQQTAGHEAAHIVAANAFDVTVTEVMVRSHYPGSGSALNGHVANAVALNWAQPWTCTPEQWWHQLVIALAGNAYDRQSGRTGFLSTHDTDLAHKMSTILYRYRIQIDELDHYTSADDIFDQATEAATKLVAAYTDDIQQATTLLLAALDRTDGDTLSEGPELASLIDEIRRQQDLDEPQSSREGGHI